MDGVTITAVTGMIVAFGGAATALYKTKVEGRGTTVDSQVKIMAELNEKLNEDNERLRAEVQVLRTEVQVLRNQVEDMPTLRRLVADQNNLVTQLRKELDVLKGLK